MKITTNISPFNSAEIYNNNIIIFKELDYQLSRYNIAYCITIVKINKEIVKINKEIVKINKEDILSTIRLTDRVIDLGKCFFLILFTHTKEEQAYSAILALERKIIKKTNVNDFIKCSVVEVKKGDSSKEKLRVAFSLICINTDKIIITEGVLLK